MKRTRIRRRSRVFRRRHVGRVIGKICLWLLVIPVAVGGYYLADYLVNRTPSSPADTPTDASVVTTEPSAAPTTAPTEEPTTGEDGVRLSELRAIYLPSAALRNLAARADTLTAASAAGYNAVIVDLKDADGALWYASATELAVAAGAAREDALTLEELRAVAETLRESYHLTLVPRLFAFRDNTAPRNLDTARVTVAGQPSTCWFDASPSAGGRRWLNPYAADARRYITSLASELTEAGFPLLMLDGVQFPDREVRAYYGDAEQTALSRSAILTRFVSEMNEAVGSNGWLLCETAMAAVGEKTTVYGGNPVTYGAPAVAPWTLPSQLGSKLTLGGETIASPASQPYEALSLLLSQLQARLQLMDAAAVHPIVVPWLQADDCTPAQIADQQRAVTTHFGERAPYILYSASGQYAFA